MMNLVPMDAKSLLRSQLVHFLQPAPPPHTRPTLHGWSFLPQLPRRLGTNPALDSVVVYFLNLHNDPATAAAAKTARRDKEGHVALQSRIAAIRDLRACLTSEAASSAPETLCAAIMLSRMSEVSLKTASLMLSLRINDVIVNNYVAFKGESGDAIQSIVCHGGGISALLRQSGPFQADDTFSESLLQSCTALVVSQYASLSLTQPDPFS